jgi:hypothetical protein
VSDNDVAKIKQEIKTTPQSTNDLENSIAFFISTKKKRHTTPVVAKKHRAVDATANLNT